MNKWSLLTIKIICVFFFLGVIVLSFKNNKLRNEIKRVNTELSLYDRYMITSNNKFEVDNISILNEKEEKLKIKSLLVNRDLLIYRFSYLNCDICIENELNNISKIVKDNPSFPIIILAKFKRISDFHIFIKANKSRIKCPIYMYEGDFNITYDKSMYHPYYFSLDTTLVGKNIFIPEKGLNKFTHKFFQKMINAEGNNHN